MANTYDPKSPVTELSKDFIKDLILHQTVSSLRRAAGDSENVVKIEGTKKVPTVYYIFENPTPAEPDQWAVHALITDVQKFLLLGLSNSTPVEPTPEVPEAKKFRIQWDGATGGVTPRVDGGQLIFEAGEIKWYPADEGVGRTEGNRVGAVIIPAEASDVDLITKIEINPGYEGSTPDVLEGEAAKLLFSEYDGMEYDPGLYYYPLIKEVGQTAQVIITYEIDGKSYEEPYSIEISSNCTLAVSE